MSCPLTVVFNPKPFSICVWDHCAVLVFWILVAKTLESQLFYLWCSSSTGSNSYCWGKSLQTNAIKLWEVVFFFLSFLTNKYRISFVAAFGSCQAAALWKEVCECAWRSGRTSGKKYNPCVAMFSIKLTILLTFINHNNTPYFPASVVCNWSKRRNSLKQNGNPYTPVHKTKTFMHTSVQLTRICYCKALTRSQPLAIRPWTRPNTRLQTNCLQLTTFISAYFNLNADILDDTEQTPWNITNGMVPLWPFRLGFIHTFLTVANTLPCL